MTNDDIEAYARSVNCERHRPLNRACVWEDNKPCACRIVVDNQFQLIEFDKIMAPIKAP